SSLYRINSDDSNNSAVWTLSLHDALPILGFGERVALTALLALIALLVGADALSDLSGGGSSAHVVVEAAVAGAAAAGVAILWARSEEHTSELQSREKLGCRLLLEKDNIML